MKIRVTNYIAPRQCGKTSMFVIPMLLKYPNNTIVITPKSSTALQINEKSSMKRCFSQNRNFSQMKADTIIIDDALFCTNKNNERFMTELYEVLVRPNGSCGEIITISTSNRVYDIDVLNTIKWLKEEEKYDSDNLLYDVCNILYGADVDEDTIKKIDEECKVLEWSFLTYPFSKIISLDYMVVPNIKYLNMLGEYGYNLKFLNKWNNKYNN